MNKLLLFRFIVIGSVCAAIMSGALAPQIINADSSADKVVKHGRFCDLHKSSFAVKKTLKMIATAYASVPDETDATPFITASGKHVKDGIIANNMLPFGTKIRIPKLYGGKVFTVEDRMHPRKGNYMVDVWMPSKKLAQNFGAKMVSIEILAN